MAYLDILPDGPFIGVHLLNLLTIPAIVVMYYYRRYNVTKWGTFWAFLIGCIITGVVQKAVIVWSIKGAGNMDIFFVNGLGLPFFTGFAFFFYNHCGINFLRPQTGSKKELEFFKARPLELYIYAPWIFHLFYHLG